MNDHSKQKDGYSPLFFAAKNGHTSVVKILLENGANPNLSSKVSLLFSFQFHFKRRKETDVVG